MLAFHWCYFSSVCCILIKKQTKKNPEMCVLNLKCCASNLVVLNGLIYVKYLEEKSAFAIKVCIS